MPDVRVNASVRLLLGWLHFRIIYIMSNPLPGKTGRPSRASTEPGPSARRCRSRPVPRPVPRPSPRRRRPVSAWQANRQPSPVPARAAYPSTVHLPCTQPGERRHMHEKFCTDSWQIMQFHKFSHIITIVSLTNPSSARRGPMGRGRLL